MANPLKYLITSLNYLISLIQTIVLFYMYLESLSIKNIAAKLKVKDRRSKEGA